MIEVEVRLFNQKKHDCLGMCFNHYFVTDVKPAICQDDNCLYDPSTINQLIDEEDLINKM